VLKQSTACFGVAAALLATAAFAQPPQPPSGGPRPSAPAAAPSPQPGGPITAGQAPQPPAGGQRTEGPPPPSKAAHFRIEQGDNAIDVKCADEEPMRACADAVPRQTRDHASADDGIRPCAAITCQRDAWLLQRRRSWLSRTDCPGSLHEIAYAQPRVASTGKNRRQP
jgi:hypothetical protein